MDGLPPEAELLLRLCRNFPVQLFTGFEYARVQKVSLTLFRNLKHLFSQTLDTVGLQHASLL